MHEEVRVAGGGMLHVMKEQGTHISQPFIFLLSSSSPHIEENKG